MPWILHVRFLQTEVSAMLDAAATERRKQVVTLFINLPLHVEFHNIGRVYCLHGIR